MKKDSLISSLENLRDLSEDLMGDDKFINSYQEIKERVIKAVKNKNKIFFCGNGGSFADAQHLTAEFVVRFKKIDSPKCNHSWCKSMQFDSNWE